MITGVTMQMLQQLELWNEEGTADWAVRASARARRLSVRVYRDGGVEIVVPPRVSARRVAAFVAEHREWIERQRSRTVPRTLSPFPPGDLSLTAVGEHWSCKVAPGKGRAKLRQQLPNVLQLSGDLSEAAPVQRLLRGWLTERGLARLGAPLLALAAEMDVQVQKLQLRWQRTRWGSCSRHGTISLNGCLLFQRPEVLRYLLIHELAHLRHMNHSAHFWEYVARFEPDWRMLDSELLQGWRRVPTWIFSRPRLVLPIPGAA
jgi:predicted metal-dependent hydrolase